MNVELQLTPQNFLRTVHVCVGAPRKVSLGQSFRKGKSAMRKIE